ncbi:unnamed protein product [Caenorhabditis bovis]|uniref:Major sperm protein n=1 Tax=Caenorhabditis bovis TaxID=2654633 RepID=A0A8S1FCW6_9PELO|nr:unnamed protein product [Caenorhabditis bovis]
MPYHLLDGNKEMIVFEDIPQNQIQCFELTNKFDKRMKFLWESSVSKILKVIPNCGELEPGQKKSFELHYFGENCTDMEFEESVIKLWWTPANTRKRAIENTEKEMEILFAVHVAPNAMDIN